MITLWNLIGYSFDTRNIVGRILNKQYFISKHFLRIQVKTLAWQRNVNELYDVPLKMVDSVINLLIYEINKYYYLRQPIPWNCKKIESYLCKVTTTKYGPDMDWIVVDFSLQSFELKLLFCQLFQWNTVQNPFHWHVAVILCVCVHCA